MKLATYLGAALVSLSITVSASATPLVTDPINGNLTDGGKVMGTVTVDAGAGSVQSINLSVFDKNITYLFSSVLYQTPNGSEYYFDSVDAAGDFLLIAFQGSSLVGFTTADPVCTTSAPCGTAYPSFFRLAGTNSGIVVSSAAVTPEPSSLVLLGTGVLGIAGAVRRRFTRA